MRALVAVLLRARTTVLALVIPVAVPVAIALGARRARLARFQLVAALLLLGRGAARFGRFDEARIVITGKIDHGRKIRLLAPVDGTVLTPLRTLVALIAIPPEITVAVTVAISAVVLAPTIAILAVAVLPVLLLARFLFGCHLAHRFPQKAV